MLFINNHMNRSSIYPLALSGILILTLAAESLLLAFPVQASVFDSVPGWLVMPAGVVLYALGMWIVACIALNYSRSTQRGVFLGATLALATMAFVLFEEGLATEALLT